MERYLYFCNNDADGSGSATDAPNTNAELAMSPTSSVRAIFAASATTTTVNLVPRDGSTTTEDVVTLTHADGNHKAVFNALVAIINAEKNNKPFAVVSDKENSIFNLPGVTACAITSAD